MGSENDENNNSNNNNIDNVKNKNENEISFAFIWWDKVKDLFDNIPKGYSWISNKFKYKK